MKNTMFAAAFACLALGPAGLAADAPATKTPSKEEMEMLRRTLQEQRANPDKIIRTPSSPVAAPPAAVKQSAQVQPPPPKPAPAVPAKAEPAKPAPAPATAAAPAKPSAPVQTQAVPPAPNIPTNFPTWTELEDAYLNRKISSRRFEEALKLLDRHQKIVTERQEAVKKMLQEKGIEPPPPPPTAAEQKKISDVESKADELLRLKAQRERAAGATAAPTGPLTKRQRLDDLLRQMIDGKISDAEYKAKRDKIIAEPD